MVAIVSTRSAVTFQSQGITDLIKPGFQPYVLRNARFKTRLARLNFVIFHQALKHSRVESFPAGGQTMSGHHFLTDHSDGMRNFLYLATSVGKLNRDRT